MAGSQLESLKQDSVGHLLIKAARLYNEMMISRFRRVFDLPGLQLHHLNLFAFIELDGSTVNEIASRAGISKQAVSKGISELVSMGLLVQRPNPEDARSKLVTFPESGPYTLEKGMSFLKGQDVEIEQMIGLDDTGALKRNLTTMVQILENKAIMENK